MMSMRPMNTPRMSPTETATSTPVKKHKAAILITLEVNVCFFLLLDRRAFLKNPQKLTVLKGVFMMHGHFSFAFRRHWKSKITIGHVCKHVREHKKRLTHFVKTSMTCNRRNSAVFC